MSTLAKWQLNNGSRTRTAILLGIATFTLWVVLFAVFTLVLHFDLMYKSELCCLPTS